MRKMQASFAARPGADGHPGRFPEAGVASDRSAAHERLLSGTSARPRCAGRVMQFTPAYAWHIGPSARPSGFASSGLTVLSSVMPPDPARTVSLPSCCLALTPGIGPRLRKALLGSISARPRPCMARPPPSDLRARVRGIGQKLSRSIVAGPARDRRRGRAGATATSSDVERARRVAARAIRSAPRTIPDPPGVLFVRGEILPADGLAVAIVGTRHATQYGLAQAERLAAGLARGGLHDRQRPGAGHRRRRSSRGAQSRRPHAGRAGQRRAEYLSAGARAAGRAKSSLTGAVISENPPRSPPLAGRVSAAEPDHHRPEPGRDRRRSLRALRRADFRPARHGARPRGVCRARPRR